MDHFFTPPAVATQMIRSATVKPQTVGDFAAGAGELLDAARRVWTNCEIVATDLCEKHVRLMRRRHSDWSIGRCDVLRREERDKSRVLRAHRGAVDLILLNPPFSCRGGTRYEVMFRGCELSASIAMAFVITCSEFLSPKGEIVAIVPESSLGSQKDRTAWCVLREAFAIEVVARNGRGTFEGCFPRTAIVRLSAGARATHCGSSPAKATYRPTAAVGIVRGVLQMHCVTKLHRRGAFHVVHTTDLREGEVILNGRRTRTAYRAIAGPAVLIPRVGKPNPMKVCVYSGSQPIVLSDCVIGIQCASDAAARSILKRIRAKWCLFEHRYTGTCAPYITIESLRECLAELGIIASVQLGRGAAMLESKAAAADSQGD